MEGMRIIRFGLEGRVNYTSLPVMKSFLGISRTFSAKTRRVLDKLGQLQASCNSWSNFLKVK